MRHAGVVALLFLGSVASAQQSPYAHAIPPSLHGPFISDPDVVTELESRLNFERLMQARDPSPDTPGQNPFNLPVATQLLSTIQSDLTEVRNSANATDGQLSPSFL